MRKELGDVTQILVVFVGGVYAPLMFLDLLGRPAPVPARHGVWLSVCATAWLVCHAVLIGWLVFCTASFRRAGSRLALWRRPSSAEGRVGSMVLLILLAVYVVSLTSMVASQT